VRLWVSSGFSSVSMGCTRSGCSTVTVAKTGEAVPKPGEPYPETFQAVAPLQEPPREKVSFHDEHILSGKLGSGAFAAVYLAHKVGSTDPVAVKVTDVRAQRLGGSWAIPDTRRAQAAAKEIRMLKLVTGKPMVLRFLGSYNDIHIEGALSYIVVEKCDSSLLQVLERDPTLSEKSVKRIFSEMLQGLAAVHAIGVVHRDVKPDNFLCVGKEAVVRLCDFGLAATAYPAGGGLTGIFGTPPFMAPEMLSGQGYCAKVDAWSLGVIVYALLYGQFPYKPVEPTGPAMKAAILAGTPVPSFRPKQGLESSGGGISTQATSMLRDLLNRSVDARPSCQQALSLPWFTMQHDDDQPQVSLRPMLYSAKRIGCFDVPSSRQKATEVDLRLTELQEKRHGVLAQHASTRASNPEAKQRGLDRDRQERGSDRGSSSSSGRPKRVSPSDTSTDIPSDGAFIDNGTVANS